MFTDFDALEDLTKAATQGSWDYKGCEVFLKGTDFWPIIANCRNANDAAFIAVVNPNMVLKLIARLRKVKTERDWLADTLASYCSHTTGDEQANCGISPCPEHKIGVHCLDVEKCDWLTVASNAIEKKAGE